MSAFPSVNVVNPGAGGPGGGAPQGQFNAQMGQQNQQFMAGQQMDRAQMAQQKAMFDRQMQAQKEHVLIENNLMAAHEKFGLAQAQAQEAMANAVLAGDTEAANRASVDIDGHSQALEALNEKLTKLNFVKDYVRVLSGGGSGSKEELERFGNVGSIGKDFHDAWEAMLADEARGDQDVVDRVRETAHALNSNLISPPTAPMTWNPEDFAHKLGAYTGTIPGISIGSGPSSAPPPGGAGGGVAGAAVKSNIAGGGSVTDQLVMRLAPSLGLAGEEETTFRLMLSNLEKAYDAQRGRDVEARNAALESARDAAQSLKVGGMDGKGAVDPSKIALTLTALQKVGAEGRLARTTGIVQQNQDKMAQQKVGNVGMSPDAAVQGEIWDKVEGMGVLGFGLREKAADPKAGGGGGFLFKQGKMVETITDKDGHKVYYKEGPNLTMAAAEAGADVVENGGFKNRGKYLAKIRQENPKLADRIEQVLAVREQTLHTQERQFGVDPGTNVLQEIAKTKTEYKGHEQGIRNTERQLFVEGQRRRTTAKKGYVDVTSKAAEELTGRTEATLMRQLAGLNK